MANEPAIQAAKEWYESSERAILEMEGLQDTKQHREWLDGLETKMADIIRTAYAERDTVAGEMAKILYCYKLNFPCRVIGPGGRYCECRECKAYTDYRRVYESEENNDAEK